MRVLANLLLTLAVMAITAAGCSRTDGPLVPPTGGEQIDTAPPAVPTGLTAAAGFGNVKLAWSPNTTDLDLAGYIVYRQVDGRTIALNDTPLAEARFIDRSPLAVPSLYGVTAIDSHGNESAWIWVADREDAPWPEITSRR